MVNERIVVCSRCGCLYDLHYIIHVVMDGKHIKKFDCKNCGMVDVIFKNLADFQDRKGVF